MRLFPCLFCCVALHSLPLSHQDDSDEEPSTAAQTPEHDELMEYVSLSCEEGEETTSSEVSSCLLSLCFIVLGPCLKMCLFTLSRTMRWKAAIPTMKSGKVTAQGLFLCLKSHIVWPDVLRSCSAHLLQCSTLNRFIVPSRRSLLFNTINKQTRIHVYNNNIKPDPIQVAASFRVCVRACCLKFEHLLLTYQPHIQRLF